MSNEKVLDKSAQTRIISGALLSINKGINYKALKLSIDYGVGLIEASLGVLAGMHEECSVNDHKIKESAAEFLNHAPEEMRALLRVEMEMHRIPVTWLP